MEYDKSYAELTETEKAAFWADADERLEAAGRLAEEKSAALYVAHEAFHGKPIRMVVVGARRGFKGQVVCHDCYYGKEWK